MLKLNSIKKYVNQVVLNHQPDCDIVNKIKSRIVQEQRNNCFKTYFIVASIFEKTFSVYSNV